VSAVEIYVAVLVVLGHLVLIEWVDWAYRIIKLAWAMRDPFKFIDNLNERFADNALKIDRLLASQNVLLDAQRKTLERIKNNPQ
jgi:hypothetical protein